MEHDWFRKGAYHEPPLLNPRIGMCCSHQRMRPAQCARGKQLQRTGASPDQKFLLRPLRCIWIGQRHVAAAGLRSAGHRSPPRRAIVRGLKTRLRTCTLGNRRGRWKPTRAPGYVVKRPARLHLIRTAKRGAPWRSAPFLFRLKNLPDHLGQNASFVCKYSVAVATRRVRI